MQSDPIWSGYNEWMWCSHVDKSVSVLELQPVGQMWIQSAIYFTLILPAHLMNTHIKDQSQDKEVPHEYIQLERPQRAWRVINLATSNINANTTELIWYNVLPNANFDESFDSNGRPAEWLDYWISIRAGSKTSRALSLTAALTTWPTSSFPTISLTLGRTHASSQAAFDAICQTTCAQHYVVVVKNIPRTWCWMTNILVKRASTSMGDTT